MADFTNQFDPKKGDQDAAAERINSAARDKVDEAQEKVKKTEEDTAKSPEEMGKKMGSAPQSKKKLDKKLGSEISAKYSLVVSLTYEINEIYKESGVKGEFKEKFNNTVRFAYDNFDPEMVVLLFKTIMSDYKIKFNIRTDLDKDVYKVFAERYTKYIV